jgi:hypothetical protein
VKVVLGVISPVVWCQEKISLCRDFKDMDRILPSNAQLLAMDLRLASIYSPRPIYYDVQDVNPALPFMVFLWAIPIHLVWNLDPAH